MILECCGQWMAPLWQLGRAGSLAWAADHLWCDTGLWLVEADHVTLILASDWLTESDVGGPVVGPAWPLSSKVNDFNQFLITDHTPAQDQWDKLGHSGPQHLSQAFPPLLCVWMPFWRGSRKVGVRCVVLTWPGAVTTATLAGLVRLFHHTAMAGLIGTSWGCSFVQHMTKWCETQAASPNSKNLKGRVRMPWWARGQQSFWIILTLVLT